MSYIVINLPMIGDSDAHVREYLRMIAEKAFRQAQDHQRPGAVSFAMRGIASLSRNDNSRGLSHT